jgi:hypothetical protein
MLPAAARDLNSQPFLIKLNKMIKLIVPTETVRISLTVAGPRRSMVTLK